MGLDGGTSTVNVVVFFCPGLLPAIHTGAEGALSTLEQQPSCEAFPGTMSGSPREGDPFGTAVARPLSAMVVTSLPASLFPE